MKYKSFDLTNFIGLKHFSPESISKLKGENEKHKQYKTPEKNQAKATTRQCAKCKKNYESKDENYVYSYSEKKKDYKKFFLCENCIMKCKKCNKTGNTGAFVYIYNEQKSDYDKIFYCMGCYKSANLKQCQQCKKRTDSEIVVNGKSFCKSCRKVETKEEGVRKVKPGSKDDSELVSARKEQIRKEVELQLPKKAKDDSKLLKLKQAAEQLQKTDITKLKNSEINKCSDDLKSFLQNSKSILGTTNPINKPLETIIDLLNIPKNVDFKKDEVPKSILDKVMNAMDEIHIKVKEGGVE